MSTSSPRYWLSDSEKHLAIAFVEKLRMDGLIDSEREVSIEREFVGLSVACQVDGNSYLTHALYEFVMDLSGASIGESTECLQSPRIGGIRIAERQRKGSVYIMTNPAFPGKVKVGMTSIGGEQGVLLRAAQLSSGSGVPEPFQVAWFLETLRYVEIEAATHRALGFCRSNSNREFFDLSVEQARNMIVACAAEVPLQ